MEDYTSKTAELFKRTLETRFVFEVAKCCGYSELVTEFKLATLHDLYRTVSMQFESNHFSGLYFVNAENDIRILIPDTNESLRQFIMQHQGVLRPVYPIPAAVVYKVFMADACGHVVEENENNDKNKVNAEPVNEIISINSQAGSTITLKIHIS